MTLDSRRIVIVGGVAGGASAATRARRMNEDAEIILFEKDSHVSFANCGLPYYIGGEIPERGALLVATRELLATRFRLDVRVEQEVIAIDRAQKEVEVRRGDTGETYRQPYDKLILAPGADPFVPPIEGANAPNVLTLRNLADTDRIKALVDHSDTRRVLVVGAGFIGLEMVEQLVQRGIETTLAELQPQVLPLLDPEMAQPLASVLQQNGVAVHLSGGISRVIQDKAGRACAVELSNGAKIETDLVILGLGIRPNTKLAVEAGLSLGQSKGIATNDFMQTDDPDIYAVGDAAEYPYLDPQGTRMRIALAGPANRAGRLAGEHAATGCSAAMQRVFGTSIVRLFNVSAGLTGLTMNLAKRMNRAASSVTIVGNHHAGYFPGAQQLTLKLVFDPETGKVLGAQAVGGDGVDKRLDVIATAMHFDATVRHLAGLDLAYAPPFGSAKDPVHMAAFAACNQLDHTEAFCEAGADLSDYQVVDVRTPAECTAAPLLAVDQPIQIPVDQLRDRLDQLDASRPTVVTCAVGVRGHVAARILKQRGFDVKNLAGGATVHNRAVESRRSDGAK